MWAHNSCPPLTGVNTVVAPNSQCNNAVYGSTCSMSCAGAAIPVSGSTTSTCMGQYWSSPPLVCQTPCDPSFAVPANVASVRSTLMSETFDDTAALVQGRWFPLDVRQTWGQYWNVGDSQLQVRVCVGGSDECHRTAPL